jgi:hypothetical protein
MYSTRSMDATLSRKYILDELQMGQYPGFTARRQRSRAEMEQTDGIVKDYAGLTCNRFPGSLNNLVIARLLYTKIDHLMQIHTSSTIVSCGSSLAGHARAI